MKFRHITTIHILLAESPGQMNNSVTDSHGQSSNPQNLKRECHSLISFCFCFMSNLPAGTTSASLEAY